MPIPLFEHNQKAYDVAVRLMRETGRAAIIHPTGTGKSLIGFKLAGEHPKKRVCWLSPSEYIFKTQIENMRAIDKGFHAKNITFLTYAKLMLLDGEAIAGLSPGYIVLDEFHRCGASEWGKGVAGLLSAHPSCPVLGLSATNIRYLDGQRDMADELFDGNVASEMTLGEAIARGILPPPKYVISVYSYQKEIEKYQKRIDQMRGGGLRETSQRKLDDLRRALENAEGLGEIFEKHMPGKNGKYAVFCSDVEQMGEMVKRVPEWFPKMGPPHVYTVYADDKESGKNFEAFKHDDAPCLKLLFCIDMLNEGVHVEGLSGVILFRPTVSPIIYKQQIGRALSAGKGEAPVIFDIVNNFDNLYSIGTIDKEMREAVERRQRDGDGQIINERFHIIDEAKDCRVLFEQLQNSLSASWELYFQSAKAFFQAHGHLEIPKRYKNSAKLSVGQWVATQRRVRAGLVPGNLSAGQIERLSAIGMVWGNAAEQSWERAYEEAKLFFEARGHLDAGYEYVSAGGFPLGHWLNNCKVARNQGRLAEGRIARLDEIGMVWDKPGVQWERNFESAERYFAGHGDLRAPTNYVDGGGVALGAWLRRLRGKKAQNALREDQISRLEAIGMEWGSGYDLLWEEKYREAEEFYLRNGHLNVPSTYMTESGSPLGKWVYSQRKARGAAETGRNKLSEERIRKLDEIGMEWGAQDPWEKRYEMAKRFYEANGHLNIPASYRAEERIWLGKWVYVQRVAKREGMLSEERVERLDAIGMNWNGLARYG